MKEIMFMVGSARQNSFNGQLARAAEQALSGRALVRYADLESLPMFNQDAEVPAPAAVERLRGEVASMDGVWLFSPEYNGLPTPLLLNALDWLSRPTAPGVPTPVTNLPVVLAGAGGARSAAGSLAALEGLCRSIKMYLVDTPAVGVAIGAGFGTGVLTLSDEDQARIQAQADALLAAMD